MGVVIAGGAIVIAPAAIRVGAVVTAGEGAIAIGVRGNIVAVAVRAGPVGKASGTLRLCGKCGQPDASAQDKYSCHCFPHALLGN